MTITPDDLEARPGEMSAEDTLARLRAEAALPQHEQRFVYYLHDNASQSELRENIEQCGVRLSEEAWKAIGRPFYEVALRCTVDPQGKVTIKEAIL